MVQRAPQLAVVSGKGGTGKTSVLASFAALAEDATLADCDVDAANLHLLLHPDVHTTEDCWDAKVAIRDQAKCSAAGDCERLCRFGAITTEVINARACEGCGLCVEACPNAALRLEPVINGHCFVSSTAYGPMVHAKLLPGAESSGRLVTRVRQRADEVAAKAATEIILIDGPPGIGCTATAALVDVDLVVVVTEPTLSAMHDMERVAGLIAHFGLPMSVLVNKADLNAANADRIRDYCRERGLPVLPELPYDEVVPRSISAQVPLVEFDDGPVSAGIREAWWQIGGLLAATRPATTGSSSCSQAERTGG